MPAGLGIYLLGTRVFLAATGRIGGVLRVVLLVATFQLARLWDVLAAHRYLWLLAVWAVMCAVLGTVGARSERIQGSIRPRRIA